jgi:hypothetical protein
MNTYRKIVSLCVIIIVGLACVVAPHSLAAGADEPMPAVIDAGFKAWSARGTAYIALETWKKGGLLDADSKPLTLTRYFSQLDRTLGKYKSYESVQLKSISQSSRIIYLAVNFEHGAIYARFLVYRTDKDWVVQNMDFSPKPEALMPWLAFTGEDYGQ